MNIIAEFEATVGVLKRRVVLDSWEIVIEERGALFFWQLRGTAQSLQGFRMETNFEGGVRTCALAEREALGRARQLGVDRSIDGLLIFREVTEHGKIKKAGRSGNTTK